VLRVGRSGGDAEHDFRYNPPMRTLLALVLLGVTACTTPTGDTSVEPSQHQQLLGLWRVVEIENLDTGEVQPANPEHHMYTESHEMIILAGRDRPKINKSISDMSVDEVMSQQPIGAGFYSYRVDGDKLMRTNIIALSAYYEGKTFETEFEVDGDTLVTRDRHAADGDLRQWTMERVE
jgi:hypothetical protein